MLNGIDVSSHQTGINVGANGVPADFVIVKATGGKGYINPDCDRVVQQALSSGKKVGVYHFVNDFGYEGTAEQNADWFNKNTKGYVGKVIPIVDWEASNKSDVNFAKRVLDLIYASWKVKPWFYTYSYVVNAYDFSSIAKSDYALWIANYGLNNVQGYSQPSPPVSNGFSSTACYQYTSRGRINGYNGDLDLNVFYGDRETWDKYVKVEDGTSNSIVVPKNELFDATSDEFIFNLTKDSNSTFYFDGNTIFELSSPVQLDHIKGTYEKVHGKQIPYMTWTPEQLNIYQKMYEKKIVLM